MVVKFNKKQIKALASIHAKAERFFDEFQAENPSLYKECDRAQTVRCFEQGILENIIRSGETFLEDLK